MNDAFAADSAPLTPNTPAIVGDTASVSNPARSVVLPGEIVGVFYGQLSGLLKSGMPLPNALRTLSNEASSGKFRAALERAATAIDRGSTPEEAFRAEEQELGGVLGRVTAATAATGELPTLLAELSAWTLNQDRIQRKITDALMYPYSVLVLACVLGMVFFSVAKAFNIYDGVGEFGSEWGFGSQASPQQFLFPYFSPEAAQLFIGAVLTACLIVPVTSLLGRLSATARRWREGVMVRLPVVSSVCRPLALSRFCGCVALLLKAGRPYHEAVAAAGPLTGFAPYAEAAEQAAEKLRAGATHSEAWANARLFPASLRYVLESAEVRGDLPKAFAQLSELYQIEAEGRGRIVTVLAPPVFLVGVGLVISVMLFGFLNPLLRIMEAMGR